MKVSLGREADQELSQEARFYAQEGGLELSDAFLAEFQRVASLISAYPDIGAVWRINRRRFSLRKFPFHVIYYLRDDEVRIVAIAHHRRKPDYWKQRE